MKGRVFKTLAYIFIIVLLTILTQVGGLIFMASLPIINKVFKEVSAAYLKHIYKFLTFGALYILISFFIVPPLASFFGRTPLPVFTDNYLRPHTLITCALNRHYVRKQLRVDLIQAARKINSKYPGTITYYLDANFPFFNGFPLFPHLSHNDGKKVDLGFYYVKASTRSYAKSPSLLGYGICEEPIKNEENVGSYCSQKGYWQYSLLKKLTPQQSTKNYVFDALRTKELVNIIVSLPQIKKIFIEPHLKKRLGLTSDKIRFHGCRAVRHDDHLHVEM